MARVRTPPQNAFGLVEHRWTCAVLRALLDGELRLGELEALIEEDHRKCVPRSA